MDEKPRSSIFLRRRSEMEVSPNLGNPFDQFDMYADAYSGAAKTLFDANFENGYRSSLDAVPIAFLYRHAVELYLKAIARKGAVLLTMYQRPPCPYHQTHSLTQLLTDVKPVFQFMSPKWDLLLADITPVITDLEKDDELGLNDQSGDMWRYPVRKMRKADAEEREQLPVTFAFDLREFTGRMETLTAGLSNVCVYLDMQLDYGYQMLADTHYDWRE